MNNKIIKRAEESFLKEIYGEDATHFDLMNAFKRLVIEVERCGDEEFYDMLDTYLMMKKIDKMEDIR